MKSNILVIKPGGNNEGLLGVAEQAVAPPTMISSSTRFRTMLLRRPRLPGFPGFLPASALVRSRRSCFRFLRDFDIMDPLQSAEWW